MQTGIQRELKRISQNVSLIVIDECHCQISWQGFRDAFASLPQTIQSVFESSRPPLLLMTATLPSDQQTVLMRDFNLAQETNVIRVSCDRENLSIQIKNSNNKNEDIMQCCLTSKSKGNMVLIYVATPQDCEKLLQSLSEKCTEYGLSIRKYHGAGNKGSMQASDTDFLNERKETLRLAKSRQLDICICTSAFSMGIDIPHIDTVIHMFPPPSLAEYAQQIGRAGRNGCSASAIMFFDCSAVSHVFSLWIGNKDPSVMQKNFVDFQSMMSFIYSEKCRRKFVRHIIEGIECSAPLASDCNCDNCNDDHINVREMAPAMHMLLSAIQQYGEPVCISRVADALFAHAPKHRGQWNDSQTPMWGKGATMFRPTKQASIWSSLASVAVHELQFLQATLHSHVAPAGNMVVYQRLSLTAKGEQFLSDTAAPLLVRERFVPVAAWETVVSRCIIEGCKNKAKVPASVCAKHKREESTASQRTPAGCLTQDRAKAPSQFLSQASLVPNQTPPPSRTASQCTPDGYLTQDFANTSSPFVSQVSLVPQPPPPPPPPQTETYTSIGSCTRRDKQQSASKPNHKHGAKGTNAANTITCRQFRRNRHFKTRNIPI
jgi:superfamily II DNA helicase RecQ